MVQSGDIDTLRNIDNVTGSQAADILTGSSSNTIKGGAGNDTIYSSAEMI